MQNIIENFLPLLFVLFPICLVEWYKSKNASVMVVEKECVKFGQLNESQFTRSTAEVLLFIFKLTGRKTVTRLCFKMVKLTNMR